MCSSLAGLRIRYFLIEGRGVWRTERIFVVDWKRNFFSLSPSFYSETIHLSWVSTACQHKTNDPRKSLVLGKNTSRPRLKLCPQWEFNFLFGRCCFLCVVLTQILLFACLKISTKWPNSIHGCSAENLSLPWYPKRSGFHRGGKAGILPPPPPSSPPQYNS